VIRSSAVALALAAARTRAFGGAVRELERAARGREDDLAVLMYHRVEDPDAHPERLPGLVGATPGEFAEQVRFLSATRRVVAMEDVVERQAGGRALPARSVLLTFDDAYTDFAEHAWPVLRRAGLPAAVFVPTAFPGAGGPGFWWDSVHHAVAASPRRDVVEVGVGRIDLATSGSRAAAFRVLREHLKSLPHEQAMHEVAELLDRLDVAPVSNAVLDWDSLRGLSSDGVTVAAHSRTHPLLTRTTPETLIEEIAGSRADLEREIPRTLPVFAYPSGAHDDAVVEATASAGFRVAFTTERGTNDARRSDWLRLRRINVSRRSPLSLLRIQLLGLERRRPSRR
jgi:peptidoglycan/xylan/chitin deacetylase (PgdA/CDA1 family)